MVGAEDAGIPESSMDQGMRAVGKHVAYSGDSENAGCLEEIGWVWMHLHV